MNFEFIFKLGLLTKKKIFLTTFLKLKIKFRRKKFVSKLISKKKNCSKMIFPFRDDVISNKFKPKSRKKVWCCSPKALMIDPRVLGPWFSESILFVLIWKLQNNDFEILTFIGLLAPIALKAVPRIYKPRFSDSSWPIRP